MRNYSAQVINALKSQDGFIYQELIQMNLNGGDLLLSDAPHDVVHNGLTYLGNGLMQLVEETRSESELVASEFTVSFSNVNQTMLALFLNKEQRNRLVKVYRVLLPYGDNVTIGELLQTRYRISSYSCDGKTLTVSFRGVIADLFQVRGIVTTMDSMRRFYPDDTSFINASSVNENIKWGGQ